MRDNRVNGDDFFDRWHDDGDAAFAILQDGFEFPTSVEVFDHGLELARRRAAAPIPVVNYARWLVDTYEPQTPEPS